MGKVTVYQFTIYDITHDEKLKSRRLGTLEGIEAIGGEALEHTGIEIDESAVGGEVDGLTERDFNPNPRTGFQTKVT